MDGAQADAMKKLLADKLAGGTPIQQFSEPRTKRKKRPSGSKKPSKRGGAVPVPVEFGSNETRDDQLLKRAFTLRDDAQAVASYLDNGQASVWCVDINGQTALFQAVFRSKPQVTRLLLERGAVINKIDNAGGSPIFYAAYAGFAEGVDLLLRAGANLGITDRHGNTPLHDLAGDDKYMTKKFHSPKIAEERGEFFMAWSPAKGSKEFENAKDSYLRTAQLMLDGATAHGLDPHARNHAGESAADLAERAGFGALKQLIHDWDMSTGRASVDGQDKGQPNLEQASSDVAEIREKIKQLYMQFNPHKVHKVDLLMEKYKGQEQELLDSIRNKYVVIDKDEL